MPTNLTPVDYDPFASAPPADGNMTPVDYDPFAAVQAPAIDDVPHLAADGSVAALPTTRDVEALQQGQAAMNYAAQQGQDSPLLQPGLMQQSMAAQPGAAFDARFGRGTAAGYIDTDTSAQQAQPSWLRQQLGAAGDQDYGEGWGYLIDNPVTRGLGQAATTVDTGLAELAGRAAGAVGFDAGQRFAQREIAANLERQGQLAAPADAGYGALVTQAASNLGGQLAIGGMAGGTSAAPAAAGVVRTGLMGAARSAVASPALRMAGTLGATQAASEAAALDAEGHPVSAGQLGTMIATGTAGNLLPIAGRWNLPARIASGAISGEAANEASNLASGRPIGTGAVMATSMGAALGVLPGHGRGLTLREQGAATGFRLRRDDAIASVRDITARQDLQERVAAAQQNGPVTEADAQAIAQSVAEHHGTSVDRILQTPASPAEAGARAADAILAEAHASLPALDGAPFEGLDSLQPRAPELPRVDSSRNRDELVQAWRDARTDDERARAAADIAAFDQRSLVDEHVTLPSPEDIPEFPDLNPRQREVEARARQQVTADPDAAIRAYQALPGTDGGRIISTDEAREIFPDYNAGPEARSANAVAVHEPASWVAKAAWKQALGRPRSGEQAYVLFTGGGTGSGKTTGMGRIPGLENAKANADIVYDGNLQSTKSAVQKIEQALKSKRKVRIVYTFRDPVQAFVHGALPRAEREDYGRTVPVGAHVGTHIGAAETYLALKRHYANNPDVSIVAIGNNYDPRAGVSAAEILPDDAFPQALSTRNRGTLASEVRDALESERQAGHVSDRVYHGTLGTEVDRGQPQGGAGLAGRPEAGPEAPLADRSGNDRSGAGPGDGQATENRVTQTPPEGGVSVSGDANHATSQHAIVELPVTDLSLSDDVPQFKSGANSEGVVEPLGGTFDRRGTGPIQVWRRADGRLEVISGRHRLDLARRSGEHTIPAQVYDEADGFDASQAASLDAELNIRDGQGKVSDYVQYFQHPAFDGPEGRQAAESRGLLARATGRRAYAIASQGDAELIAAHRAGRISDEAAVQIAQAAPNDPALQALGMQQVQQGRSITSAVNTMRALGSMRGDSASQGDIFGFDDSAIRDADAMGKVAARRQREISERLAAITGAAKRPEIAKREGIDVKDPQAIQHRIGELRAERDAWENWATDPDKVAQVREEAGLEPMPDRSAPEPDEVPLVDDRTGSMFSRYAGDRATTDMFGDRPAEPERPARAPAPANGDMFGGPSTRDFVDAATRAKDAQRNGLAGGRQDTGDGGLFDGERPEQSSIPGSQRQSRAATAERGTFNAAQVHQAARKAWGNRFITRLERAGVLHVIDTDEAVRLGLGTADGLQGVKGLYQDGKAYVLADQVQDLADVPGVVVHEAGLHYGYDRLTTPEERQQLRRRIDRALVDGDADVRAAWQHAEEVGTPASAMHEEAMAYLAEHSPGHGLVTRLVDAVKRGLNRVGIPLDRLESDSEAIRRLARDMLRRAGGRSAGARADAGRAVPASAPMSSRYQVDTPEFRQWFGDSKVVDAEGRPLRVYHGTGDDVSAFDKSKRGAGAGGRSAREGFFFTDSPEVATQYADEAPEFARTLAYKRARRAEAFGDFDRAEAMDRQLEDPDFTGGKSPNVMPVYLRMENPKVIDFGGRGYNAEHDNLTQIIRDAKAAGHDGVIFRNIDDAIMKGTPPADHYVVFDPEQIKSATGNRGTFDPSNPDIRYSRAAPSDVRRQAALARASVLNQLSGAGYGQGAIGWNGNPNEYHGWRQAAISKLSDKFDPVRRVERAITDASGRDIADDADVYRLENLMHGRAGDRLDQLDRTAVRPLLKSMKQQGISPKLLMDYLYARHAPERNARIASINPNMPDGGSGLTTQQANDILAGRADGVYSGQRITPDNLPALKSLAARVDRIRDQTLNTLEHSGQITPALAGQLRQAWQHYVPLRGKEGDADTGPRGAGRGVDIKGKPIRRALGRGAGNVAPPNILAEIVGDAQRAIIQAEKARVGRAVLKLAAEFPNPDIWQVEPVDMEWRFSESTGEAYLAAKKPTNDTDVLTVVHAGTPYHIRLVDPRIRDAVLNLGTEKALWLVKTLGRFNRWISAVSTRYNPAFTPINALRDMTLGMTGLLSEHGKGVAADAAKLYLPALRASWRDARHGLGDASVPDAQKSMDDWAREFGESGGKTGIVHFNDVEDTARRLDDSFKSGMDLLGELRPLAAAGKALEKLEPIVHVVEHANDAVENALRLAAYTALRKRGMSIDRAAAYAKDLTVNFNRKGQWGGALNSLFLFYNASAQGVRRGLQLMRNPKVMAFLGSMAALQASQTALLMSRKGEDGVSDWDAIPDWKKQRSLIIALPGKGNYFALPMPYEFGFLTYAGGRILQSALDDEPSHQGNLVNDLGIGLLQSFSPIPLDNGPTGLMPEALKVPMQLSANRDDFGRRITNEQPYASYDVPRSAMGKSGTATPYVLLSRALNRLGGGDPDYRPPQVMRGMLDWSPEDLQYLSDTMLGGLGSFVSGSWVSTEKLLAGNYKSDKDGTVSVNWSALLRDMPILKSFGWSVDTNRARSDRYYDIRESMERTKAIIQDRLDHGDLEGAQNAAREAGVFADGWTIRMNADGTPATRAKVVDGNRVRTYQLAALPGTLAAAYKEAGNGLTQRDPDTGYSVKVQDGVSDYNRQIRNAYQLPVAERTKAIKDLQDQRGGLMGAFLRFYEQRKQAVPTPAK